MPSLQSIPNPHCKHGTDVYLYDCMRCEVEAQEQAQMQDTKLWWKPHVHFYRNFSTQYVDSAAERSNNWVWWATGFLCGILFLLAFWTAL